MGTPVRRRRTTAAMPSKIGMISSRIGTAKAAVAGRLNDPSMATAPSTRPIRVLPESPRKIRAGGKLYMRKPASAPAKAAATTPSERAWVKQAMIASVRQMMSPMVAARPSRPSSMLKAFIDPTSQNRVRSKPDQPSSIG